MRFIVTALGNEGTIFTYDTEGPDDATDMQVRMEVYRTHGRKIRAGHETEFLGPFSSVLRVE